MIAGDAPRNMYTTVLRAIGLKESSVCVAQFPRGFVHRPASRPIDNVAVRCYEKGGVQYAPYQEGSWVEKPWHVCCCYSHDVSGEQALQGEVVMETKPSRDGW